MGIKLNTKLKLLKKCEWKCERCGVSLYFRKSDKNTRGSRKAHFHHIIHRSKGGSHSANNLLVTCWPCECKFHEHNKS